MKRKATAEPHSWKSGPVVYGVLALVLIGLLLLFVATQSSSTPLTTEPAHVPVPAIDPTDALRKADDLASCRAALDQANRWLAEHPDRQPKPIDFQALKQLRVADHEIIIASRATFAPLDAAYLESSLLLADAARSLGVEALPAHERAERAFDWVCRQVRLRDATGDPFPPHQVLRRGYGTALERAVIFCALAQQLGLAGAFVDCPVMPSGGRRLWLAGALADEQLYLFEPRLGVPLRTPSGHIATLAQLRKQPDLVNQFDLGGKFPYDVTVEQAAGVTAQPAGYLTALAPRMQVLQELLGPPRPVTLHVDAGNLVREFTPRAGEDLRLYNFTRVLSLFYDAEQGGSGQPDKNGMTRQNRFKLSLIDGRAFPRALARLPADGQISQQVFDAFERPFLDYFQNANYPRALLARGRLDDAIARLVELRDRSATLRARAGNRVGLDQAVADWTEAARQAEAELALVQDRAAAAPIIARMEALWQSSEPVQLLILSSAAQALAALADYDLALIKQEQAERLDTPAAWQAAADRWQQHRQDYPGTHDEARLHHAQALVKLGQLDEAVTLLENAPATTEHWNRHAFMLRAKLLKASRGPG